MFGKLDRKGNSDPGLEVRCDCAALFTPELTGP